MKQRAVVVAPGRGTYNRTELGYLTRHHRNQNALLEQMDARRRELGQIPLTELDSMQSFSGSVHTRGDNASALIHACAYCDFLAIDQDRFDILGVTGNSMGWYIALTCAGALGAMDGFDVVNTMGTLMQEHLIGGQLVYPFVDETWQPIEGRRQELLELLRQINARDGHVLDVSIDLGGMFVLAGNEAGLTAFETQVPRLQDRFPMRLPNHAGFHTALQEPVAALGQSALDASIFGNAKLPLIDGRGGLWHPFAYAPNALWHYTLWTQVVETYDFCAAIRTTARELMPDVFIVLGPGNTLGGAVAQSLVQARWRGWETKSAFQTAQLETPRLLSMGIPEQRAQVVSTNPTSAS